MRLLDTNHAIGLLKGDPRLLGLYGAARESGDIFALSSTAIGELFYGAFASQRIDENLARLRSFLEDVAIYDFNLAAAEEFGRIRAECRDKGRPVPVADAQIAAIARLRGMTILTDDRHYDYIEGVVVENWLR